MRTKEYQFPFPIAGANVRTNVNTSATELCELFYRVDLRACEA